MCPESRQRQKYSLHRYVNTENSWLKKLAVFACTRETWKENRTSGQITVGPEGAWPTWKTWRPRETSVLRGFKGACKRPPEIARWSPIIYRCFIAICKCFCTEIAVEKHFDPPKCDFWRGLGASKNFLGSLSLAIFYGPLINYAVIRPLCLGANVPIC